MENRDCVGGTGGATVVHHNQCPVSHQYESTRAAVGNRSTTAIDTISGPQPATTSSKRSNTRTANVCYLPPRAIIKHTTPLFGCDKSTLTKMGVVAHVVLISVIGAHHYSHSSGLPCPTALNLLRLRTTIQEEHLELCPYSTLENANLADWCSISTEGV